jgi:hypothetical protein
MSGDGPFLYRGCILHPEEIHKGRTMRRFVLNRWWVLLLASALAVGMLPGQVSPARASTVYQTLSGISGYGDPDVPSGVPIPGKIGRTGENGERRAGGDSRTSLEMGALRLRILLELLRAFPVR